MWEPQQCPGSSRDQTWSIRECFVMVLNTFGRPARFQFFNLLATPQLIDRQTPWEVSVRMCLLNRQLQADTCRQTATERRPSDQLLGATKVSRELQSKKWSVPNCFVMVLNTFGRPTRFQFFNLLAAPQLIDRQTHWEMSVRRCLLNRQLQDTCRQTATERRPSDQQLGSSKVSRAPEPKSDRFLIVL